MYARKQPLQLCVPVLCGCDKIELVGLSTKNKSNTLISVLPENFSYLIGYPASLTMARYSS
jgi:hypothetical protein